MRHFGEERVKLILWWFVAAVEGAARGVPEEGCAVEWYSYADVLGRLTFQMDRELVARAIELVESTYGG